MLEFQREVVDLVKELTGSVKDTNRQLMAQQFILNALFHYTASDQQQKVHRLLKAQVSAGELQGLAAEACELAEQIVSALLSGDEPPDNMRKSLQLIRGGKAE